MREELIESIEDEKKDMDKYLSLAKMADEAYPDKGYGAVLRDIAREEGIHRQHLEEIVKDMTEVAK